MGKHTQPCRDVYIQTEGGSGLSLGFDSVTFGVPENNPSDYGQLSNFAKENLKRPPPKNMNPGATTVQGIAGVWNFSGFLRVLGLGCGGRKRIKKTQQADSSGERGVSLRFHNQ